MANAIVGAAVTVTVEGFGSKSGIVDNYDRDGHPTTPYHVAFKGGMSGWFNAQHVRFDDFSPPRNQDPIASLANRLLNNPRPYTPHLYPPPNEEDDEDDEL